MADKPATERDVKLTEELTAASEELAKVHEKNAAIYSKLASAMKGTAQAAAYAEKAFEESKKAAEIKVSVLTQALEAEAALGGATEETTAKLKQATKALTKKTNEQRAASTITDAAAKGQRNLAGALGISTDATDNFVFQIGAMVAKMRQASSEGDRFSGILSMGGKAANTMASFLEQGLIVALGKAWQNTMQLNSAQYDFARSIGASEAALKNYKDQMSAVTTAGLRAGVTAEQTGEAYSELYRTVTNFTHMQPQQQQALSQTTTLLMQNGTAASDLAQSMQMLNKVTNQAGETLAHSMRRLESFSRALGVPPAIIQRDFAAASMNLAIYGDQMVNTFMDLAETAKQTGLSMNQLMTITGRFDTFDGAADAAGRLNAVLGRDLFNSLDMLLTTDPTERFRKLRQGIEAAAGSFQEMSYYEKRAIADAAGLADVGELALLMSRRLEQTSQAQQANALTADQMADQQARLMSIQQKWQATLAALAGHLEPLMDKLVSLVEWINRNADAIRSWIPRLVKLWGVMKLVGAILPLVQTYLMATGAAAMSAASSFGVLTASILGPVALVAGLSALIGVLFKPKASPSLYDGLAILPGRLRANAAGAREAGAGFRSMGDEVARVVPATSQALGVIGQFDRVDTNHMDKIATSIRGISSAINSVDTTKSLQFRANVSTLASTEMSQVVTAAVRLKRDDVAVVTDLVTQANKLAAASTVSRGDEMSALVQSVAQIARIQGSGGGAGGAAQSTPIVVENTLKLDGHTLDRHIQRVSRKEIDRQSRS